VQAIAADWAGFRAYYAAIRQRGHYLSNQEVDQGTVGLAAAIRVPKAGPLGVVSLVFSEQRLGLLNPDGLARMLHARMAELAERLGPLVDGPRETQVLGDGAV
jgi:DNA-binding IclR family transcriptional regulator